MKKKFGKGGCELVFMLQVPVNKRHLVIKCLLMQSSEKNVCCCESEFVIPSLEDGDSISLKCIVCMIYAHATGNEGVTSNL
jgi:hypothetical protein